MDEAQKKRLFKKLKRQFQTDYQALLDEVARFRKEVAAGKTQPTKFYLETVDMVLVCRSLTMCRVYLEKEMQKTTGTDPHAVWLDTEYVRAKELRALLHDVLNGRFTLIFHRSNK